MDPNVSLSPILDSKSSRRPSPAKLRLSPCIDSGDATFESQQWPSPVYPQLASGTAFLSWSAALVASYVAHSYATERVVIGSFGEAGSVTSLPLLILLDRVLLFVISAIMLTVNRRSDQQGVRAGSIIAFASTAACSFAATFCRYESLHFLTFSAQSFLKAATILPAVYVAYGRSPSSRTTTSLALAALATGAYALANVSILSNGLVNVVVGAALAGIWLFTESLASAGLRAQAGLDMISFCWAGLFGAAISLATGILSAPSFFSSLAVVGSSGSAAGHVFLLALSSAVQPILIAGAINALGHPTASTLDSGRAVIALVSNALCFGQAGSIVPLVWTAVGWLGGAHVLRLSDSGLPYEGLSVSLPHSDVFDEKTSSPILNHWERDSAIGSPQQGSRRQRRTSSVLLYAASIILPIILGITIAATTHTLPTSLASATDAIRQPFSALYETAYGQDVGLGLGLQQDGLMANATEVNAIDEGVQPVPEETVEEEAEIEAEVAAEMESEPPVVEVDAGDLSGQSDVVIEGGKWSLQVHAAINPTCPTEIIAETLRSKTRTVLATFPRSGNSYIRGLFERMSGYRTSSIYCDKSLLPSYKDECSWSKSDALIKSHYPAISKSYTKNPADHFTLFDQAVWLVRNPLDTFASYLNYYEAQKIVNELKRKGKDVAAAKHELHPFKGKVIGSEHKDTIRGLITRYRSHSAYWNSATLSTKLIRYEDLRVSPLPVMMDMIAFTLGDDNLPDMDRLICGVELHESAQAYHSPKNSIFAAWTAFSDENRKWILKELAPEMCRFGYTAMAESMGYKTGIDCRKVAPISLIPH